MKQTGATAQAYCPRADADLVTCPSSGIECLTLPILCYKPLVVSQSIHPRPREHDIGRLSAEPVLARWPFKCSKHKLNNLSCKLRASQARSAAHQRVGGAESMKPCPTFASALGLGLAAQQGCSF